MKTASPIPPPAEVSTPATPADGGLPAQPAGGTSVPYSKTREYFRRYHANNRAKLNAMARARWAAGQGKRSCAKQRARYWADPERGRERARKNTASYLARIKQDPVRLLRLRKYQRLYRARPESRKRKAEYEANKKKNDPAYRIEQALRTRMYQALRKSKKSACTEELVGCAFDDLKKYLEKKFLPGMSWSNYTRSGWHIDHIRPCASFDLSDPAQQRECFHYTNLQPLWAADNLSKSAKHERND